MSTGGGGDDNDETDRLITRSNGKSDARAGGAGGGEVRSLQWTPVCDICVDVSKCVD